MRSNSKIVKDKINEHILENFEPNNYGAGTDAMSNLIDQLSIFTYLHSDYKAGQAMAMGGTFLIYTYDMESFLNGLGINPTGKKYSDTEIFEQYCHLIGRQVAELASKAKVAA